MDDLACVIVVHLSGPQLTQVNLLPPAADMQEYTADDDVCNSRLKMFGSFVWRRETTPRPYHVFEDSSGRRNILVRGVLVIVLVMIAFLGWTLSTGWGPLRQPLLWLVK